VARLSVFFLRWLKVDKDALCPPRRLYACTTKSSFVRQMLVRGSVPDLIQTLPMVWKWSQRTGLACTSRNIFQHAINRMQRNSSWRILIRQNYLKWDRSLSSAAHFGTSLVISAHMLCNRELRWTADVNCTFKIARQFQEQVILTKLRTVTMYNNNNNYA